MLGEWRRAQREVWELDASLQHLQSASRACQEQLLKHRRYQAEIGLAARRFRGAGPSVAAPPELGEPVELEDFIGRDAAQTWARFLQALTRRPSALPALAGEAGYAAHELLAGLASSLIGDPLWAAFGGGFRAARVLDEVLGAEFSRLEASEAAAGLFSDGTFLAALLQELTTHEPACMLWARSVLSPEVLDAVGRLSAPSRPSLVGASRVGGGGQAAPPSLQAFLGGDENSPLCQAASAIVASMCEWAASAPLGLCRLAAALGRQLEQHQQRGPGELREARRALLGNLLLGRWLLPALLAPGVGFVLHGDGMTRSALTALAKLLKAVSSPVVGGVTRGWGSDDGAAFGGASAAFVAREAERLGKGLFDVLLDRGACDCSQEEGVEEMQWPQCIVCSAADLASLSKAFAREGSAERLVRLLGVPLPAPLPRPQDAAIELTCWLQREMEAPALQLALPRCRGASEGAVTKSSRSTTAHSQQSRLASSLTGDMDWLEEGGMLDEGQRRRLSTSGSSELEAGVELILLPPPPAARSGSEEVEREELAGGSSLADLGGGAGETLQLLWQVLADPRPLDGPEAGDLAAALASGELAGCGLPQQLRAEMLLDELRRSGAEERRLLSGLQAALREKAVALPPARQALARMQTAERLLGQHSSQVRRALRQHVRLAAELRVNACLQALWAVPPEAQEGAPSGPPALLELCIVAPPAELLAATPAKVRGNAQAAPAVRVFERARCPCHYVAALGATMGFASRLEKGFKHWSVRSLSQAVKVLKKLPLETALRGHDFYGIAAAVHTVLEQAVAAVVKQFRIAPVVTASEAGSSYSMGVPSMGAGCSEEWARPAALTSMDNNHVRECVARFLFTHLHGRLFPAEATSADLQVAERARQLCWLQPRHLDLPVAVVESPQVKRAGDALKRLHRLRSPEQMLAELSNAFRTVTEACCIRAQLRARCEGRESEALGADSALPLFILVVLRANPPMLTSVLAYAESFIAPAQRLTEQGYALTQAHASVKFVRSARSEDLNALEPGEWERHMGPAVTGSAV